MALRNIRTQGDSILTKKCRKVEAMTPKLKELIEDMFETMYDAYGVGLAAPPGGRAETDRGDRHHRGGPSRADQSRDY